MFMMLRIILFWLSLIDAPLLTESFLQFPSKCRGFMTGKYLSIQYEKLQEWCQELRGKILSNDILISLKRSQSRYLGANDGGGVQSSTGYVGMICQHYQPYGSTSIEILMFLSSSITLLEN